LPSGRAGLLMVKGYKANAMLEAAARADQLLDAASIAPRRRWLG
jgi:hypothetical protein